MTQIWSPKNNSKPSDFSLKHYEIDDLDVKTAHEGGFYTGYKIGEGRFVGHLSVAKLGDMTTYKSYDSHTIVRRIKNASSDYIFVVSLDDLSDKKHTTEVQTRKGLLYGHKIEPSALVGIIPPNSQCIRVSPPHATCLKLRVKKSALGAQLTNYPELAEWFNRLDDCKTIQSRWLARRLRADLLLLLDEALVSSSPETLRLMKNAVLATIVNAFDIEFAGRKGFCTLNHSMPFVRFRLAHPEIQRQLKRFYRDPTLDSFQINSLQKFGSRRSMEQSFAHCVGVGPRAYSRILRLHHCRRKLMDAARANMRIGELAAMFGFEEHARFSVQYRRHFGETPSATQQRALE